VGGETDNKARILEAAAAEFAERGFDGARVDSIALRAGVNKALIYYYYSNKEELLDLLFLETRDAVLGLIESIHFRERDLSSPEALTAMLTAFLELMEERQNVVRVILMELSKRTPINTRIFELVEEVMNAMFAMTAGVLEITATNRASHMVTEFFTGIMPLLNYVAYHEIWMERYHAEESVLRAQFIESFLGTHFAYTFAEVNGKGDSASE